MAHAQQSQNANHLLGTVFYKRTGQPLCVQLAIHLVHVARVIARGTQWHPMTGSQGPSYRPASSSEEYLHIKPPSIKSHEWLIYGNKRNTQSDMLKSMPI